MDIPLFFHVSFKRFEFNMSRQGTHVIVPGELPAESRSQVQIMQPHAFV